MRFVIIESPLAGNVESNIQYARNAMHDSLIRGEAPFASHLLYTQVLDDLYPKERVMGIDAGLHIGSFANATVVYTDRGISRGMQIGIDRAKKEGREVVYRSIE